MLFHRAFWVLFLVGPCSAHLRSNEEISGDCAQKAYEPCDPDVQATRERCCQPGLHCVTSEQEPLVGVCAPGSAVLNDAAEAFEYERLDQEENALNSTAELLSIPAASLLANSLGYISAYGVTHSSATVAWKGYTANSKYSIYVNNKYEALTTATSYVLRGLTPATTYKVQVKVAGTYRSTRVFSLLTLGRAFAARENAITALMAKMTLQEKVEQTHGVLNNPTDGSHFITADNSRLNIAGFSMKDGSYGVRGGMLWPAGVGCAASWNTVLQEAIGRALGNDHRGLGDDVGLGPTMDIFRDLRWGRGFESFGEDPFLSGKMAAAKVRGMQASKCVPTIKHFAAYAIETGRGGYKPVVPERTMREIYALPFEMAVKEGGALAVMSSYSGVDGISVTENAALQQRMLKDEWGFQGMVVSDWGAAYKTVPDALAGLDVEMPGDTIFGKALLNAMQSKKVPSYILDDKVRRILRVKDFLGSVSNPNYSPLIHSKVNSWLSASALALVKQAGREAMVLAKNNGLLPLSKTVRRTVAIVGPTEFVNEVRSGGQGSSYVDPCPTSPLYKTPYQAIKAACRACTFVSDWKEADQIIAILGVYDAGEGYDKDSTGLMLPVERNLPGVPFVGCSINQNALISAIAASPKAARTVVVLTGGSAAVRGSWSSVGGVLIALYPGNEQGSAIADVLFGTYNPAGRLPITYPAKQSDMPRWGQTPSFEPAQEGRGWTYYEKHNIPVLFPFGHGLSYTTFKYSGITMPATMKQQAGVMTVKITVTNVGRRGGDEVVQLYVAQVNPRVPRREKDLRGFKRVYIAAGAATTVSFSLSTRDVSYWSPALSRWVADLGRYNVLIGASSKDIRETGSFLLVA